MLLKIRQGWPLEPSYFKKSSSVWFSAIFSARCNIYISRLCYDVSVRLSLTEVHWRIIANLGFKFDPNLPRIAVAVHAGASTELFIVQWARGKGSSPASSNISCDLATAIKIRASVWILHTSEHIYKY